MTATDPDGPKYWFFAVISIRRTPSPYPTLASSATVTSRPFEGSAGRISTVVSARSAAMNWMRPAGMSRTAEIGSGVLKVGMSYLPDSLVTSW